MTSPSQRIQKHREKLRASGLRPVQIWVPDTRQAGFADECRRQSAVVAQDPQEREIEGWLADVADRAGWS